MSGPELALLLLAGVIAGLASTITGLASVVSYPVLLAVGLSPLAANVTNTVALATTSLGAAGGSMPELAGQRQRVLRLGLLTAAGGATGSSVLLLTPAEAFATVAPWLIAGASGVLLVEPRLQRMPRVGGGGESPRVRIGVFLVAIYSGYFGAAAGVLMLALLSATSDDVLARVNAVKNVISGFANGVAALGFAVFGPVHWAAAAPLAVGLFAGSWLGPSVVRRLPADRLRVLIAITGLVVAAALLVQDRLG